MVQDTWEHIEDFKNDLRKAYKAVEEAAGKQASIIVAGYPGLFNPKGNGWTISAAEAGFVNYNAQLFMDIIREVVNECHDNGMNIFFVDVMEAFYGHEAYATKKEPWINEIILGPRVEDIDQFSIASSYSCHPNLYGARDGYAKCINKALKEEIAAYRKEYFESGKCGDNLTWGIRNDGVLEISGTGAMKWEGDAPWYPDGNRIMKCIIEEGVTSIGNEAFAWCEKMSEITIPDSVTRIGDGAFMGCKRLRGILIPGSVTDIGKKAFNQCGSLEKILTKTDNPAFEAVKGVLFDKGKTTLIRYPSGKTADGYEVPEGVKRIDSGAFEGSSVIMLTMPKSVTDIDDGAFLFCEGLTDVFYGGSESDKSQITMGMDNTDFEEAVFHYRSSADPKYVNADLYYILSVEDVEGGWNCEVDVRNYYTVSEEDVRKLKPGDSFELPGIGSCVVQNGGIAEGYVSLYDGEGWLYELHKDAPGEWRIYVVYSDYLSYSIGKTTVFIPNEAKLYNREKQPVTSPREIGYEIEYEYGSPIDVRLTFVDGLITMVEGIYHP